MLDRPALDRACRDRRLGALALALAGRRITCGLMEDEINANRAAATHTESESMGFPTPQPARHQKWT